VHCCCELNFVHVFLRYTTLHRFVCSIRYSHSTLLLSAFVTVGVLRYIRCSRSTLLLLLLLFDSDCCCCCCCCCLFVVTFVVVVDFHVVVVVTFVVLCCCCCSTSCYIVDDDTFIPVHCYIVDTTVHSFIPVVVTVFIVVIHCC